VHPKARIIADAGPIVIGEGNLIEERCEIINRYVLPLHSVEFLIHFYCATRMHSAYMPWQDVRLSVRHTPV